jgi:hypothetical protein
VVQDRRVVKPIKYHQHCAHAPRAAKPPPRR